MVGRANTADNSLIMTQSNEPRLLDELAPQFGERMRADSRANAASPTGTANGCNNERSLASRWRDGLLGRSRLPLVCTLHAMRRFTYTLTKRSCVRSEWNQRVGSVKHLSSSRRGLEVCRLQRSRVDRGGATAASVVHLAAQRRLWETVPYQGNSLRKKDGVSLEPRAWAVLQARFSLCLHAKAKHSSSRPSRSPCARFVGGLPR